MERNQTNEERILSYINYGSPLNQGFLVERLTLAAENVVNNEAEVLKELENGLIYGPAWVQAAKDWLAGAGKMVMACDDCNKATTRLHIHKPDGSELCRECFDRACAL